MGSEKLRTNGRDGEWNEIRGRNTRDRWSRFQVLNYGKIIKKNTLGWESCFFASNLSFPMFPRCSCLPEPPRSCFTSALVFPGTVYQSKSCQGPLLRREKSKHPRTPSFLPPFHSLFSSTSFFITRVQQANPLPSCSFYFRFFFVTSKTKVKPDDENVFEFVIMLLLYWSWNHKRNHWSSLYRIRRE